MTATTKTTSSSSFPSSAAAVAITPREYGYIRLLSAVTGQPEEVLLADYLAGRARKAHA